MTDTQTNPAAGPRVGTTSPAGTKADPCWRTDDFVNRGAPQASRAMALRLVRAVDTLGRLPMNAGTRPAGTRSAWPEMIRDSRFAIGATRRSTPARPTPAAIDDLDRLAMLLWQLPPYQRQLLWARACGVRWAELCHRYRRSRTTLNRDHRRALVTLVLVEDVGAEDVLADQDSS